MIDMNRFHNALKKYIDEFPRRWYEDQEHYKWEAVSHFQNIWDIEADDFPGMLTAALSKTSNLLSNANNFPAGMIIDFAKRAPEEVRAMFLALYEESQDVYERISTFRQKSGDLLAHYGQGARQHFQTENTITTYLWLRFPDKYYIYKYGEVKNVAEEFHSDYQFKKGAYAENIRSFLQLYDEINHELIRIPEISQLLNEHLTEACYPDSMLHTLTIDFGFYVSRFIVEGDSVELPDGEWWPSFDEYTPGFSKDDWLRILNDPKIIGPIWGGMLAAFYAAGGAATCSQLAETTHLSPSSISGRCTQLAKRIYKETRCRLLKQDDRIRYWPILFQGKNADKGVPGVFIWKLRPELKEALAEFDIISKYGKPEMGPLTEEENESPEINADELQSKAEFKRWFAPLIDALLDLGGSAPRLSVHEKIIEACSIPENELNKKSKAGTSIISNQIDWSRNYLNYEGFMDSSAPNGTWKLSELGTNILMTEELAGMIIAKWVKIKAAQREGRSIPDIDLTPYYIFRSHVEKYDKNDFLRDVYTTGSRYEQLAATLRKKKNIILQGAPGVGKTFAARRLAWSMMGQKDNHRIAFIQFHQNYSYEDFVMGYKPTDVGFELKKGIFYRFCEQAEQSPDKDHFFIIDEINRGNMSKIFGELLMLIERDYRGEKVTLAYSGELFSVPENLYIIGMMNTADRSLAMIDYALRRRFSFFEMTPGFDSKGFTEYQNNLNNDTFNELVLRVQELNDAITRDKSLGKGFCIGHSYFCGCEECTEEWLKSIVDYDIIPMLSEYWFDDSATLQRWENYLHGVFQ